AKAAPRSIADARGYTKEELFGLAEIGYHYLRAGGFKIAGVIFEGLAAVEPREPYFALAMGLAADHLGDRKKAAACFERAARLDATDGRAEVNLAELALDAGDKRRAINLLRNGAKKAHAKNDSALANKANAMLALLGAR